jgi:hypothetical protein
MLSTTVTSLGALVDIVASRLADTNRIHWFRGQRDATWDLSATVWRDYPDEERNLTNRFRSRAAVRHPSAPAYDAAGRWLSLMQHYGLPTRLLDWSRSPLIAGFFALEKYRHNPQMPAVDAAIWMLQPHALNEAQQLGEVTPDIDAKMSLGHLVPAFAHTWQEPGTILAVMASEHDLRMFVQQGCFTVHSDRTPLNKRADHERYLEQVLIPAEHVRRMAIELDVCGFRKGDLFPDLANLADELRENYGPPRAGV